MILISLLCHVWFLITPMSGLMVVLSLIRLLVFPLLVLGSLLISLTTTGVLVPGGRLIVFILLVVPRLVGVFVLFLDLCSLFRGLKCGVLFLLYNPLVLCI